MLLGSLIRSCMTARTRNSYHVSYSPREDTPSSAKRPGPAAAAHPPPTPALRLGVSADFHGINNSHRGQFQATNVRSLKAELGRDATWALRSRSQLQSMQGRETGRWVRQWASEK